MMTDIEFAYEVVARLPYVPNSQQVQVIGALARFCASTEPGVAFILNGYAGTGKTSMTGALVKALESVGIKAILMAPTGRAAKVFSANSGGHPAYTIHRKIYKHALPGMSYGDDQGPYMQENPHHNTVFIVDEASMIGGASGESDLLEDLITYVYTGDNCRLILLGDTAQLPPVGSKRSPAMKPDVLRGYGLKVSAATLTETARQAADSGILFNATRLRRAMLRLAPSKAAENEGVAPELLVPKLRTEGFDDVLIVSGEDLPDLLEQAYSRRDGGATETIMITRSNRRAAEYNAAIRARILYREELLSTDDMLIVAKNHYFTGARPKGLDFIANGDVLRVEKVYGTERRYGLEFADVRVCTTGAGTDNFDPESEVTFDAKVIVDALRSEAPALNQEQTNALYYGVLSDPDFFSPCATVEERMRGLRKNPYWNALQVKFAYAVTCHKAQGGQWRAVFVDVGYVPDDALGMEFYRWLYTAVTRARKRLYLITPPAAMIEGKAEDEE